MNPNLHIGRVVVHSDVPISDLDRFRDELAQELGSRFAPPRNATALHDAQRLTASLPPPRASLGKRVGLAIHQAVNRRDARR